MNVLDMVSSGDVVYALFTLIFGISFNIIFHIRLLSMFLGMGSCIGNLHVHVVHWDL